MTATEIDELEAQMEAEAEIARRQAGLDDRTIYQRMVAIIDELPAIGKGQWNEQQKFHFRGHDDVMNALNPLLAKHGVFVVPDVQERIVATRSTSRGSTMYEVNLHVRFTFYGANGDSFTASGWGEGTDMGDKATNKAMTAAFKYVIAQTFALATQDNSDADAGTPEETTRGATGPVQRKRDGTSGRDRPEFDPGKLLAPGALNVRTEEDAVALRQGQRDLDPRQDWTAIEEYLILSLFDKPYDELDKAQKREFYTRLANAVVRVNELAGPGDFPPPTAEQIQAGYAWAFKGVVLALSVPETAEEQEAAPETSAEAEPTGE